MKSLAGSISKIAAPILGRRGFGEAQIVLEWAAIVGTGLASDTLPVKLSFGPGERSEGTLHLKVANGAAPVVQHLEPQIIERINGFFGYRAVARLAIRQGPLPRPSGEVRLPEPKAVAAADEARLQLQLDDIEDPGLRATLESYGRSFLGHGAA